MAASANWVASTLLVRPAAISSRTCRADMLAKSVIGSLWVSLFRRRPRDACQNRQRQLLFILRAGQRDGMAHLGFVGGIRARAAHQQFAEARAGAGQAGPFFDDVAVHAVLALRLHLEGRVVL